MKSILLASALMFSFSAFTGTIPGTDITYGQKSLNGGKVIYGDIMFSVGRVDARKVCFDLTERVFKTTIPAHTVETCSNSVLPVDYCVQNGGRIISTKVPATDLTAPEFVSVKKCTKYDRSDSTHPVCLETVSVQKQQPIDFTFLKYQYELPVRYYGDERKTEVRDMEICN